MTSRWTTSTRSTCSIPSWLASSSRSSTPSTSPTTTPRFATPSPRISPSTATRFTASSAAARGKSSSTSRTPTSTRTSSAPPCPRDRPAFTRVTPSSTCPTFTTLRVPSKGLSFPSPSLASTTRTSSCDSLRRWTTPPTRWRASSTTCLSSPPPSRSRARRLGSSPSSGTTPESSTSSRTSTVPPPRSRISSRGRPPAVTFKERAARSASWSPRCSRRRFPRMTILTTRRRTPPAPPLSPCRGSTAGLSETRSPRSARASPPMTTPAASAATCGSPSRFP
mmetsp:Transcript_12316/g.57006  ORF Transcript_12316/g.57006 Transcript_12316/m.57006 type:complete len:280 (-) Transcript_12316:2439-3278(-)